MKMRTSYLGKWIVAATFCLTGTMAALPATAAAAKEAAQAPLSLDNSICESCHSGKHGKLDVAGADGAKRALRAVDPDKFGKSVHAKLQCLACHSNITELTVPHKKGPTKAPDCAQCHQDLWEKAKAAGTNGKTSRLETVARNIEAYKKSFHAGEDKNHPGQPKAVCTQCHDTHAFAVPADKNSPEYATWRSQIPKLCGEACHEEQLDAYKESVHGKAVLEKGNVKAANCTSCHTTHEITNTSLVSFKLLNNEECGNCHKERLKSYRDTYHGQVTKLGYAETAKC